MDLPRRGTNKNKINNSDINLALQNSQARLQLYENFIEREAPSPYYTYIYTVRSCKNLNSRLYFDKNNLYAVGTT